MEVLQEQIIQLLVTVLTICVGIVTTYLTKFLREKGLIAKLESKKKYVGIVVDAVEQMYAEADGNIKLKLAKEQIVKLLNEKKVKVSNEELDMLIEAMVNEMKKSAKRELRK